ncbi:MAG: hypothetical protein SW019_08960, partial [Actinomycetota bacterium]|nr:hypothetical protein [Actinomycetota bacterium]
LLVTRDGSQGPSGTPSASTPSTPATSVDTSDIASADDDGPIEIITEDPTCAPWSPIVDTFAETAAQGWNDRDPSIPGREWTPTQRAQHEEIAEAMRSAADQTIALVKLTPHRVVRELYEQTIAYWSAYADKIPNYAPSDNQLAKVASASSNAITYICAAIDFGSAASRAPLVTSAPHDWIFLQPATPQTLNGF